MSKEGVCGLNGKLNMRGMKTSRDGDGGWGCMGGGGLQSQRQTDGQSGN